MQLVPILTVFVLLKDRLRRRRIVAGIDAACEFWQMNRGFVRET